MVVNPIANPRTSRRQVRVHLVEDDLAVVDLLKWHFNRENWVVDHQAWGGNVLAPVAAQAPDVIVLDWVGEGSAGPDLCAHLRQTEAGRDASVLILTGRSDEADVIRGLESGADDYIIKPVSPTVLVLRIKASLRRTRVDVTNSQLQLADLWMDVTARKVKRGARVTQLGPTEFRLLRHLLEHPREVFTRDELRDAVWGSGHEIALKSINVHIRRLRNAINVEGKPELIRTIRGTGYALDEEAQ